MRTRHRSWQRYTIIPLIAVGVAWGVTILLGYLFKWGWTGLNEHVGPNVQQYQPVKTLWDWMQLLFIPAMIAFGGLWFTMQQGKVSDKENTDNQRETALQVYIDKMSELLLHEKLRDSTEEDEVRKVARVRTLTVLPSLDGKRKRSVLQFLYEANLIDRDKPIVDLNGADLSHAELGRTNNINPAVWSHANLYRANLQEAILDMAYLDDTDLSHANLEGADLNQTNLKGANLQFALLSKADLSSSLLKGADLSFANLYKAKLYNIDLSDANLSNIQGSTKSSPIIEELKKKAKSLQGATMPDRSIYP